MNEWQTGFVVEKEVEKRGNGRKGKINAQRRLWTIVENTN